MKSIVIIDNKIEDVKHLSDHLSKLVTGISWIIAKTIAETNISNAEMLFIHINNKGASEYITQMCSHYSEIYITSAAPSLEQLKRIKECSMVRLFDVPILDDGGWKTLPWVNAISEWKDADPFPIEILTRKYFIFPEALVSTYLLLVAEQAGLVVNELDRTNLWKDAGKQFCEEAAKKNLRIPNMELIPETGWEHPRGDNVSSCVIAIQSLFQHIEGAQVK
jgi:hypothetical protein